MVRDHTEKAQRIDFRKLLHLVFTSEPLQKGYKMSIVWEKSSNFGLIHVSLFYIFCLYHGRNISFINFLIRLTQLRFILASYFLGFCYCCPTYFLLLLYFDKHFPSCLFTESALVSISPQLFLLIIVSILCIKKSAQCCTIKTKRSQIIAVVFGLLFIDSSLSQTLQLEMHRL